MINLLVYPFIDADAADMRQWCGTHIALLLSFGYKVYLKELLIPCLARTK